jgi:hypothetical protein
MNANLCFQPLTQAAIASAGSEHESSIICADRKKK